MSTGDWVWLAILVPLALWGWWIKYGTWQEKRRKLARDRQRLLDDLRRGRL